MSDLDEAKLGQWLQTAVRDFGGIRALEKFPGGQSNPTYRIDTPDGTYVLRRKPFGTLLPSAHAVDREYHLLSALHPTGFPVPRPVVLCEDDSVIGAAFYLMEMVEGRIIWDGALPDVRRPERRDHYNTLIDTLGRLHALDRQTPGLAGFGAPGNYMVRQLARCTTQYRAAQTDDIPEMDLLIDWLPRHVPEQTRTTIIHGDYRIDNVIFAPSGPQVRAVLDWELATIGDPLADFSYLAMNWLLPHAWGPGLVDVDLAATGLPSLDDVIARYCAITRRGALPHLHWYFAFNLFRMAAIIQGIKKRVLDGNASNTQAASIARRVIPLAQAAWTEARIAGAAAH